MYKQYESLINELTKGQNQYESLNQNKDKEISRIGSTIQNAKLKMNDDQMRSLDELKVKKRTQTAAFESLKSQKKKDREKFVKEMASTVVQKKSDNLDRYSNQIRSEQVQMATEMKEILIAQAEPTKFDKSKKEFLGDYNTYSDKSIFLDLPKFIVYPVIGSLLTILFAFLLTYPLELMKAYGTHDPLLVLTEVIPSNLMGGGVQLISEGGFVVYFELIVLLGIAGLVAFGYGVYGMTQVMNFIFMASFLLYISPVFYVIFEYLTYIILGLLALLAFSFFGN